MTSHSSINITMTKMEPLKTETKQKLHEFCRSTSFLPVTQAYHSKQIYKIILIALIASGMTGYMIYQIYSLVTKFYQYPVQVEIELVEENQQNFPSVTICNLNPIRINQIQGTPLYRLLDDLRNDGRRDKLYQQAKKDFDTFTTDTEFEVADPPSSNLSGLTTPSIPVTITLFPGTVTTPSGLGIPTTPQVPTTPPTPPPKPPLKRKKRETAEEKWDKFFSNKSYNQWTDALDRVGGDFYKEVAGEVKAFTDVMDKLDPRTLASYSSRLNDLLLSCRFQGFLCSPENFTWYDNYKYGRCWKFNPLSQKGIVRPELITQNEGPLYGLVLEVNIDQENYVPSISPEAGIRVVVAARGEMVFPDESGFIAGPGTSTSVGITKTEIIRLPAPHGTCQNSNTNTLYSQRYNVTYTKPACLRSCLQKSIISNCGCGYSKYIIPRDNRPKICDTGELLECARDWEKQYLKKELDCDSECPMPCEVNRYDTTISTSVWPAEQFKPDLVERLSRVSQKGFRRKNKIENDVLRLEVYYSSLTHMKIEQKEAYSFADLVSDLGGQLGLYMGISLLGLAELIGLIVTLSNIGVRRAYFRYRPHVKPSLPIPDVEKPPQYTSPNNTLR